MGLDTERRVITAPDPAALARAAADRILARMADNGGRIAICLTGGSSPKQLYRLLASEPYRGRIPWQRVHWFIGDERFVPPNDPLNNMGTAREIFLDQCAPAANVHAIPTEGTDLDEAARRYARELQAFYDSKILDPERPLFDVVLMGLGPDGHTASLFPGDHAVNETERWVVGVPKAAVEPLVPRVSLTLPTLNSCREMLFEVAGSDKRAVLTQVLAGENLPANRARSLGETVWLVDQAALPENFRGG
jgi:6-phosphogluconolactonase